MYYKNLDWTQSNTLLNFSTPTAIVDAQDRIVAIMAGHPDDPSWPNLQRQAAEALEARRPYCHIPKSHRKHRRGGFAALNCGVSHGGGQTAPGNLKNEPPNSQILDELNRMEPFRRLAGFSSGTYAPVLILSPQLIVKVM